MNNSTNTIEANKTFVSEIYANSSKRVTNKIDLFYIANSWSMEISDMDDYDQK